TIYETNKSEESFSTTVNSDEENNPVVIPPPRLYEDLEAEAKRLISFILSDSVPTLPEIIKPPAGYTTFKPNGDRDELYIFEILEEVMDNSIETPYMNVTFHISEISTQEPLYIARSDHFTFLKCRSKTELLKVLYQQYEEDFLSGLRT